MQMNLTFNSYDEFESFVLAFGYVKPKLQAGCPHDSAPQTVAIQAGAPVVTAETAQSAAPEPVSSRKRRTKAEMEADRAAAAAAMAAPLPEDDGPKYDAEPTTDNASREEEAAMAALAESVASGKSDAATYAAEHGQRLGEATSAKDFLTRCQKFIQAHGLPSYMEMLSTSGVEPKAVATCNVGQRGEILARMEWAEL